MFLRLRFADPAGVAGVKVRGCVARALERAAPFLRRQIGSRLRLRRAPEIRFIHDDSIAGQDRIEQILHELHAAGSPTATGDEVAGGAPEPADSGTGVQAAPPAGPEAPGSDDTDDD